MVDPETEAKSIKVLIVDDHAMFRESLASSLAACRDIEVVGTAADGETALRLAADLNPKVVLLDICIGDFSTFESARKLLALGRGLRVLLLSGFLADIFLAQSLKLRLSGYVLKGESVEFLANAIRQVAGGETVYSSAVESRLVFDSTKQRFVAKYDSDLSSLTGRQLEVLRHLACGLSVKEIANQMHLSQKSVDSHKYRIMNKLGIHDRVELARFAIREGLLVP